MTTRAATRPAEPTSPAGILAAADEAITTADARLRTVESLVRDGDDSVTIDHLEQARQQTQWARLRRDAAARKAQQLELEQAQQAYAALLDANLGTARLDPAADADGLMAQARGALRAILALYADRNRAVARIATYAADPREYRDPDDGLTGTVYAGLGALGSSFQYRGDRYAFVDASHVFAELLNPLRDEIALAEGGSTPEWLKGLH